MTSSDFIALGQRILDLHKGSFANLSLNDQGSRCLDLQYPSSSLEAVGFDKVKEDWYDKIFFHQVRSVDALYKHQGRYYLIEFKTGKPDNVDIHRKLYDSVVGIVENRVLSLSECRQKVQYIIVSPKYATDPRHREMLCHFQYGAIEPWDYKVTAENLKEWDANDIRKLSGFLVDKIYKLSPEDFDQFVRNRNWSN